MVADISLRIFIYKYVYIYNHLNQNFNKAKEKIIKSKKVQEVRQHFTERFVCMRHKIFFINLMQNFFWQAF